MKGRNCAFEWGERGTGNRNISSRHLPPRTPPGTPPLRGAYTIRETLTDGCRRTKGRSRQHTVVGVSG